MVTNDPYFDWLCRKVKIEPGRMNYITMAKELHKALYRPGENNLDGNRAMDGLQLRVDFMNNHGQLGTSTNRKACTMFEFLIALARRMAFLMGNEENPHRTAHFFWIMIKNIGLDKLNDNRYPFLHGDFRIQDAVDRVLFRTYDPDGKGGLFPLKHPPCDMRTVEIWYQMQLWLTENSEISLDL